MGKPLPFKSDIPSCVTQDYSKVKNILFKSKINTIIIDDAGYLITDMFMSGHSAASKGNGVFSFYNEIGDAFYHLIRFVVDQLPANKIVYFIMHEDSDDMGNVKPKTIGKLLDEKVCLEGLVSVLIRSTYESEKYCFLTNGAGIQKSPIGMFEDEVIDNDLKFVDTSIRNYWNIGKENDNEKTE